MRKTLRPLRIYRQVPTLVLDDPSRIRRGAQTVLHHDGLRRNLLMPTGFPSYGASCGSIEVPAVVAETFASMNTSNCCPM